MKNNDNTIKQAQPTTINGLNLSKGDLLQRYHETRLKHYLYGVVSFAMTAMFYISFTSPEWLSRISSGSINSAVSAGVWAFLGLMFSIVITVLIMHSHTTDKGASRLSAYALIIALGITFNVFTETASTMDRVDERVTAKSEHSGIFKALTDKIKYSSGQSNTALTKAKNDYADAISTKKARCKQGVNYSARLCRKWTMRADEYKTAIQLHKEGASNELSQTVKEAQTAGHNEAYAQMIVKITMEQLGVSFLVATAFISLFIIGTFEVLGIMIGGDYRKYRDALPLHGIDLHKGREIKYLKKDLQRQNEADEAINQHKIEQSRRELKRLQDARKTQNKMLKLQAEIKKLTRKNKPETNPTYALLEDEKHDKKEPNIDTVAPIKAFKMGFIDTDAIRSKNPIKSTLTEQENYLRNIRSKASVKDTEQTPRNIRSKNPVKDTEQTLRNIRSKTSVKDTEQEIKYTEHQISKMIKLHLKAKKTKNGHSIKCPVCELSYTKTRNRIFCSNGGKGNCSDKFYNAVKPERLKALANKRRKQGRKEKA